MTDKQRKETPIFSGVLRYFPDAMADVAKCSFAGQQQHNPDKPLAWDRDKSGDELDSLTRHLMEAGTIDTDGVRHSAKVAWRALANLQKEMQTLTPEAQIDVFEFLANVESANMAGDGWLNDTNASEEQNLALNNSFDSISALVSNPESAILPADQQAAWMGISFYVLYGTYETDYKINKDKGMSDADIDKELIQPKITTAITNSSFSSLNDALNKIINP